MNKKQTLIGLCGLPRSGKSTLAKWLSKKLSCPIVNPDSVRLAMHGKAFIPEAEPFVWATVGVMTRSLFLAGHQNVIVDATNTTRKRRDVWNAYRDMGFAVGWVDVSTPQHACRERAESGGRHDLVKIIDDMAAKFEPLEFDEGRFVFPEEFNPRDPGDWVCPSCGQLGAADCIWDSQLVCWRHRHEDTPGWTFPMFPAVPLSLRSPCTVEAIITND